MPAPDKRVAKKSPGRRKADKIAGNATHIIKLAVSVLGALSAAFLSGIGMLIAGNAGWQELKTQWNAPTVQQAPRPKEITK